MKRFRGLTEAQERVLGLIAMGMDGLHHRGTTRALEKRGLIVSRIEETATRIGLVRVRRWSVPLPIHMEWCEWCATDSQEPGQP